MGAAPEHRATFGHLSCIPTFADGPRLAKIRTAARTLLTQEERSETRIFQAPRLSTVGRSFCDYAAFLSTAHVDALRLHNPRWFVG